MSAGAALNRSSPRAFTDHIGANGLADREALIAHFERLAAGDDVYYERQRRRKVAETLGRLQKERLEQPPRLVEAPTAVLAQDFQNLPTGVRLESGRITVTLVPPLLKR